MMPNLVPMSASGAERQTSLGPKLIVKTALQVSAMGWQPNDDFRLADK